MFIKIKKFLCFFCVIAWMNLSASESYYVSPHGYFIGESEHVTDWKLAKAIVDFLKSEGAQTVVDFGCGDGDYVNYYLKNGLTAVGYDGNPVTEMVSGGTCFVQDLSVPLDLQKKFDWVISLETGEHLPKQYEEIFLENLIRHLKCGLILSWAVEGQGGTGHFNEQNNDYIKNIFSDLGWENDIEVEEHLRKQSDVSWFKNTVMVFRPPLN
ncbi:MAG: methyltransferase domain-containing protein [Verrucomicrobia bacterium]|nr:methyltransferase domain-containing protein [Verrucomicrobiota bacterium]